jgi:hypothetical protein
MTDQAIKRRKKVARRHFISLVSRRARVAVALTVAAAAVGVLATAGFTAPASKVPREIRVVSVEVGGGGADVPPEGASVGDSDTFTSVVSDPKTGRRLGRSESVCTIFDIAKPGGHGPPARNTTFHCSSMVRLRDGELTAFGRIHFDGQGRESNAPFAILGGTGRYAGARGSAKSRPLGEGKTLIVLRFVR